MGPLRTRSGRLVSARLAALTAGSVIAAGIVFAFPASPAFADNTGPAGCQVQATSSWGKICWVGTGYWTTDKEAIGAVQRVLTQLYISPGTIDCYYGPNTGGAIKNYQRLRGLSVDGIVGNQTWLRMESELVLTDIDGLGVFHYSVGVGVDVITQNSVANIPGEPAGLWQYLWKTVGTIESWNRFSNGICR